MERIVRQKQDNNKQNQECNVLKMCALREAENSKISLSPPNSGKNSLHFSEFSFYMPQ